MHSALAPGVTVRVRGPRNHFPLVASPRYLFIAGGIGITPMLPMIAEAEAAMPTGACSAVARTGVMAFLDELATYGDRVTIVPQNEMGMLDLESVPGTPQPDTLVYCCGPKVSAQRRREILREMATRGASPGTVLRRRRSRPPGRTHRSSWCWSAPGLPCRYRLTSRSEDSGRGR